VILKSLLIVKYIVIVPTLRETIGRLQNCSNLLSDDVIASSSVHLVRSNNEIYLTPRENIYDINVSVIRATRGQSFQDFTSR
jgi:hypothetical protein